MDLSLSSSLVGSATLNADKLSLDLQFATDKTLTARKGPTPTFTRASTATFVGSNGLIQSAAIHAARFDHDPVTLACRGLLIEESRTNNLTRSDDFAQAIWTKLNTTVTSNNTTSPDGTSNADSIFETTALGEHTTYFTSSSLTDATMSIFVKPNGRNNISLRFYAGINNWVTTTFLLSGAGSITQTSSGSSSTYTARSQTITQLLNGWYRCTLSASRTGGVNIISFDLCTTSTPILINTGAESYTGNASLGFHLWGAQLEAGSFATSYIPTTTASVVRSQDLCSITGSAFTGFYNQSEGTFFSQTIKTSTNLNAFIVAASNNSFSEDIDLRYSSVTVSATIINVSSVNQMDNGTATVTSGALVKQSVAYKLNNSAYSSNGSSPITDTAILIPTVSQLNIGNAHSGTLALNGHIASIRYFKKRLANAKLQTLTV